MPKILTSLSKSGISVGAGLTDPHRHRDVDSYPQARWIVILWLLVIGLSVNGAFWNIVTFQFLSRTTLEILVVAFGRPSFALWFRHWRCGDGGWSRGNPEPSVRSLFRLARPPHTMFKATAPVFSKASRRTLTPKRGNKDFYKGGFVECRVTAERGVILSLSSQVHVRHTSQEVSVPAPLVNTL